MITRIITGVCLVTLLVTALAIGGWVFSVLYMLTICLAMYEVYRALREAGHRPVQWPNWLCLALSIPLFNLMGSVTLLLPLVAGAAMLVATVVMFRPEPRLEDILVSVMPLGCVLLPGMCMLGLQNAPDRADQLMLTVMAFGVPLFGDTLAYFFGSRFGKHPFCPAVSPHKSVEGAVAGMAGSMIFAMAVWGGFSPFAPMPPWWHFLILGFLGGFAGEMGDLFASLIKRHCGLKDFGTIFPGHGGMMDRLDSVYWSTVIMYVYLNLSSLMIP
ncbi:MAG: phosphatidate cytidylyltransferase [Clostridia bacterium]|nr:phosphatidate cytidylyltransferase [Clostridia bacterium]